MKLLIVDGSKAERARLVDAFCQLTNVVVIGAVARLHTALHALGQSTPDVLVSDARLGDDEDATALVTAARRCACPPGIVIYATDGTDSDRQRCLDAGADRFVSKHAGFVALQRAVLEVGMSRQVGMRMLPEQAFISRVASGLAHDLNNQLTVVEATLGLLQKQLRHVPNEITRARQSLDRAAATTQALGRHADRRPGEPTQHLDLPMLVRRTLDMFGRSLPMNIEVERAFDEVPPIVGVDLDVEQLVMNLVLDASEGLTDGVISIRIFSPIPTRVRLVVTRAIDRDGRREVDAAPVHVDFEAA